jgi:hypothetical protein
MMQLEWLETRDHKIVTPLFDDRVATADLKNWIMSSIYAGFADWIEAGTVVN